MHDCHILCRVCQKRSPTRFPFKVRFIDILPDHSLRILDNGQSVDGNGRKPTRRQTHNMSRGSLNDLECPIAEFSHSRLKLTTDFLTGLLQSRIYSEHASGRPSIAWQLSALPKPLREENDLPVAHDHGSILFGPMMMCFQSPSSLRRCCRYSLH